MLKILLVDDDEAFCKTTAEILSLLDHDVETAQSLSEAFSMLNNHSFDHVLLDFMLPDGSGLHLVDEFSKKNDAPFITMITGHPSVKTIMSGLVGPKVNYLLKPFNKAQLENALDPQPEETFAPEGAELYFGCLVGESAEMKRLYEMIERVSKTDANVMLMGESGVGKEVVTQGIHNTSQAKGPLVATNCGAIANDLIASELFGHEKGAFTGAVSRKQGVFERAEGGTLFLDEVTEMPIESQPNLLRVLETNRITRVGGAEEIPVKCRVISATNRTQQELANDNVLREDIYFRLAVFPIRIPPLRERLGDVPILAQFFLNQLNSENGTSFQLNDSQLEKLSAYRWPGNVRELRHTIHRAYILTDPENTILALPDDIASPFYQQTTENSTTENNGIAAGRKIEDVEKELIAVTLEKLNGDKPAAAKMLGISLKTLYNRLNKYEEDPASSFSL